MVKQTLCHILSKLAHVNTKNANDVGYTQCGRSMGWRDRARRYKILIGLNVMPRFLGDKNTSLVSVTLFIDATLMTDVIL
jgi:hypothetical protein